MYCDVPDICSTQPAEPSLEHARVQAEFPFSLEYEPTAAKELVYCGSASPWLKVNKKGERQRRIQTYACIDAEVRNSARVNNLILDV